MNKILATIELIESHVNKVAKGTGKPYSATILHYVVNGEHKEKMVMDRTMRDHIVNNFHSGDTVVMTMEKNDKGYLDLLSMEHDDGTATATVQTTTATSKQVGTSDREVGMQVGNALTNAATLLASGIMTGSLEYVAEEVIRTGERLKARLLAGEL